MLIHSNKASTFLSVLVKRARNEVHKLQARTKQSLLVRLVIINSKNWEIFYHSFQFKLENGQLYITKHHFWHSLNFRGSVCVAFQRVCGLLKSWIWIVFSKKLWNISWRKRWTSSLIYQLGTASRLFGKLCNLRLSRKMTYKTRKTINRLERRYKRLLREQLHFNQNDHRSNKPQHRGRKS